MCMYRTVCVCTSCVFVIRKQTSSSLLEVYKGMHTLNSAIYTYCMIMCIYRPVCVCTCCVSLTRVSWWQRESKHRHRYRRYAEKKEKDCHTCYAHLVQIMWYSSTFLHIVSLLQGCPDDSVRANIVIAIGGIHVIVWLCTCMITTILSQYFRVR